MAKSQQTRIDDYFITTKRSVGKLVPTKRKASDSESAVKRRKLFAEDTGLSDAKSPIVKDRDNLLKQDSSSLDYPSSTNDNEVDRLNCTPERSPSTQSNLRQQLGLGEFNKVIKKPHNIAKLKACPDKCNEKVKRDKELSEKVTAFNERQTTPCKYLQDVELEMSPQKSVRRKLFEFESIKSPKKDLAYVSPRKLLDQGSVQNALYQDLLNENDDGQEICLPMKYYALTQIFNAVILNITLRKERNELVMYSKIKDDVQKITRKNFTEKHLAMFKSIYPEVFKTLSYDIVKLPGSREKSLELLVEFNTNNRIEMAAKFEELLLERTKRYHSEFLKLILPIDVPIKKIKRWHPNFDLYAVPDIEAVDLPKPPEGKKYVVPSAREVLKQGTGCPAELNASVKEKIIDEKNDKKVEVGKSAVSTTNELSAQVACPNMSKWLIKLSPKLLESIRAKQAAKMAAKMTQTSDEVAERMMLNRLPDMVKLLRNTFNLEKKNCLTQELVVERLEMAYKIKLSKEDYVKHLELMIKRIPDLLSFRTVAGVPYIKFDYNTDLSEMLKKLANNSN